MTYLGRMTASLLELRVKRRATSQGLVYTIFLWMGWPAAGTATSYVRITAGAVAETISIQALISSRESTSTRLSWMRL